MMTARKSAGRLVLLSFRAPLVMGDLDTFLPMVQSIVASASERVIFCTDYRLVGRVPAELRDALVWLMRRDNPKMLCNALLVSVGAATLRKEIQKMLDEAAGGARRVFDDPASLRQWLAPELSSEEAAALDAFLALPA